VPEAVLRDNPAAAQQAEDFAGRFLEELRSRR
jgi:hypothetical protein